MEKNKIKLANQFGQFYSGGPIITIPNGKKILFQTQNSVSIIDLLLGKIETLNIRFRDHISSIDIDKIGKYLLVVDKSSLMTIVNIYKKKIKGRLLLSGNSFLCKWSPRNKYLVVAIFRYIQIWKVIKLNQSSFFSFQLSRTHKSHQNQIVSLDWHFSGNYLISAGKEGIVKIFSFRKKENFLEININGFSEKILSLSFFDLSNSILILCQNNFLFQIDLNEKKKKNKSFEITTSMTEFRLDEKNKKVTSFNLFKMAEVFFLGYSDGSLGLFEIKKNFKIKKKFSKNNFLLRIQNIEPFEPFRIPISKFSVCTSKNLISLANSEKNRLIVFDLEKRKIIILYEKFFEKPTTMSLSNNNNIIIIGNKNGNVTVWSIKTGFCILKFSNHLLDVSKVLFHKYSSRIAISSSKDGTIKIYDLLKCKVMRTLDCNSKNKSLNLIDLNHTGFFIVSCCEITFKIFLWSVKSGIVIEQLNGHKSDIIELSFMKNELKILSCDINGIMKLWIFQEKGPRIYDFFCETFETWEKVLCIDFNIFLCKLALLTENHEIIFFDFALKKCFDRISFNFSAFLKKKSSNYCNYQQVSMNYNKNGKDLVLASKNGYLWFFNYNLKTVFLLKFFRKNRERFFNPKTKILNSQKKREKINLKNKIVDFCHSKKGNGFLVLTNFSIFLFSKKVLETRKVGKKPKANKEFFLHEKTWKFFLQKQKEIEKKIFMQKIKNMNKFTYKKIQKKILILFIYLLNKIYLNVKLISLVDFFPLFENMHKNINNQFNKKRKHGLNEKIILNYKKILKKIKFLIFNYS